MWMYVDVRIYVFICACMIHFKMHPHARVYIPVRTLEHYSESQILWILNLSKFQMKNLNTWKKIKITIYCFAVMIYCYDKKILSMASYHNISFFFWLRKKKIEYRNLWKLKWYDNDIKKSKKKNKKNILKNLPFTTTANKIFPNDCSADLRSLDSASKGKSLMYWK